MGQRKALEKLDPAQAEAKKKMHPAPDKHNPSSSSPQQHAPSMRRGSKEHKKKEVPRPRGDSARHEQSPSTFQSPHYMKPTSCSDAKKERVQVQFSAPKTPKTSIDNDSSPSTSLKTLARKASLRPRRPSMKKISAASALSPRRSVTRATCSSTMKDFKFPNVQHLDPGVKRAELTSIEKVCPFGYCSLHGRRHHHLKRLPSVRRRSLKTQASMKLKRLPSHRKRSFRKGRRSIASGKIKRSHGSKMSPVIEEVSDDFSVEIDATPQENYLEHKCKGNVLEMEISKILCNLDSIENDVEYIEEGSEEFDGTMALIEIPEIYSRISFGDNLDQSSDISLDDLYGDSCFPAYEAKEETLLCFNENIARWIYEYCGVSVTDDRNRNLVDWEDNRSIGGIHIDVEEEARSFGVSESESGESSYGSEEKHDEIGSFAIAYDEEAGGLFGARQIKSSNSFDEVSLSVGISESDNSVDEVLVEQKCTSVMNLDEKVPDSDLNFPSDAVVLEKNGHCSEHGEERSTIKVQKTVNLEISNNHGDHILNLLADVFIQSDSAEETILGGSLVIQGSGLSNDEISDLITGNDQNSDVQKSCIQLNQSYEFNDSLKMEASELVDLHEPNLVLVNSIVAEAADDNDNVVSVLERISSQSMNFEETDIATRVEMPDNIIRSSSAGGGGNKTENCNSGRNKYEPDDTDESELGNTSLRSNADGAEIGDGKVEGNDINACGSEESELPTHDECLDNLNISIVVENEKSGSGECEENIISSEGKTFKQDLAESELPNPNNINLSIVADEKAPGLIEESELGNMKLTTDAEIIQGKDGHGANSFRSEKSEGELQESELGNMKLTTDAEIIQGKDGHGANSFRSEKSEGELQESELDACDECPENINLSIIAENEDGESGKPEQNNISFERRRSKQVLEQSELATDDDRSNTINLSTVADVEAGDNKNEENSNDYNCKISDQGDIKELILGAKDNEAGDGNAKGRNSICIASERNKQDHEESELDNRRPDEIYGSRSVNETSEPCDCEDSKLRTGDENQDNHLNISKEDMFGFRKVKEYVLLETKFPAHHSEVFNVHQNDIVGDLIEPQLKTENCYSCGVMEHLRISSKIPDACSIDLIEESKPEYIQIFKSDSIYSGESKCVQTLQTSKVYNKQKSRHRSLNRRRNLEMEMLRLINPRAPRVLPLNPDPDSEKVDLRHQEMDEGRKPEDWMIDYALQKLVNKLAPARKKKVALLVEAFEAVVPEPICESTLMSPTSGFGRPLQACS